MNIVKTACLRGHPYPESKRPRRDDCAVCHRLAARRAKRGTERLPTTAERFWSKVDLDGPVPEHATRLGPCWLWQGTSDSRCYGRISIDGAEVAAHRWAYEALLGPIPDGLELDHLCRTPACVNPGHLEAVTHAENIRRGTAAEGRRQWSQRRTRCRNGHELAVVGTYSRPGTVWRTCRACIREANRRRQWSA